MSTPAQPPVPAPPPPQPATPAPSPAGPVQKKNLSRWKRQARQARIVAWIAVVGVVGVVISSAGSGALAIWLNSLQSQSSLDQKLRIPAYLALLDALDQYESVVNVQTSDWQNEVDGHRILSTPLHVTETYRPLLTRVQTNKVAVDLYADTDIQQHGGWLMDCIGTSFGLMESAGAAPPSEALREAIVKNDAETRALRYAYTKEVRQSLGLATDLDAFHECTPLDKIRP